MRRKHLLEPAGNVASSGALREGTVPDADFDLTATIVFTGERRNNHYRVDVCRHPVELTANAITVLIKLVLAKQESKAGFVQMQALDVFRLRRSLDVALGPGAGKWLISTGGRQEYTLNIPHDQLADRVAMTVCFPELVDLKIVTREEVSKLLELCRTVEIEAKLQRNRAEIDKNSWAI
jgi:hypothetical protein